MPYCTNANVSKNVQAGFFWVASITFTLLMAEAKKRRIFRKFLFVSTSKESHRPSLRCAGCLSQCRSVPKRVDAGTSVARYADLFSNLIPIYDKVPQNTDFGDFIPICTDF